MLLARATPARGLEPAGGRRYLGVVRSEWSRRVLLVVVSLACACLAVELIFRIVGWRQRVDYRLYLKELTRSDRLPRELFGRDGRLGTVLVPNVQVLAVTSDFAVVYRTNAHGLRDREYAEPRSPDTLRILALGDSFTFGEGVSYGARFADIPENELEGLEIVNAGVPGWGIETALVYTALEGVRYRPDWVVVFLNLVSTGREFPGLVRDGRIELPTGTVRPRTESASSGRGTWYLRADDPLFRDRGLVARHSYAFSYVLFRVTLAQRRAVLKQHDEGVWRDKKKLLDALLASSSPIEAEVGAQRSLLVLRKFAELAETEGFRLMIVNIDPIMSLSYVASADARITYHDLTPLLVEHKRHERLFFTYDMHYNPRTHAVIGRRLTDLIRPLVEEHRARRLGGR
jgi:hypothetical protein